MVTGGLAEGGGLMMCPHARPGPEMCPHCMGINETPTATLGRGQEGGKMDYIFWRDDREGLRERRITLVLALACFATAAGLAWWVYL